MGFCELDAHCRKRLAMLGLDGSGLGVPNEASLYIWSIGDSFDLPPFMFIPCRPKLRAGVEMTPTSAQGPFRALPAPMLERTRSIGVARCPLRSATLSWVVLGSPTHRDRAVNIGCPIG